MKKALEGVRVLDLSQFLSGPRAAQLLAEMGAEVIKVESPVGETMRMLAMLIPGAERVFAIINRNKKGLVINFRTEKGIELFKELVKKSDVLVENFAPGTMAKMGLSYDKLKDLNPRLIYAVITGFGLTGPWAGRTAFDIIAQATGGIMHANRQDDRPPSVFFGDMVSGAYCAVGILGALFWREKSGIGQLIDISMQDVMYAHNYQALSDRALEPVEASLTATLGRNIISLMTDYESPLAFWNSYKVLMKIS